MRSRRPTRMRWAILTLGLGPLLLTRVALAAGGALLWEDQYDRAGGTDEVHMLAAGNGRLFAVGTDVNEAGNHDFVVRAYNARSGKLLWQDQLDGGGDTDVGSAIATDGDRTFAVGVSVGSTGGDFLVRAYAAATGKLLWQDVVDKSGGEDAAITVAILGQRLFVGGQAGAGLPGDQGLVDFLVRAYDTRKGNVVWEDRVDKARGPDQVLGIAAQGQHVVAVGIASNQAGNGDALIRAYDSETGVLLWEDQFDGAGDHDVAQAVSLDAGRAFVAGASLGTTGSLEWLVRAYDLSTGALLWQDLVGVADKPDQAQAVVARGGRVYVVGLAADPFQSNNFLVRGYDARTGALLWQDETDKKGGHDSAAAASISGRRLFAAGDGDGKLLLRAYDAQTGTLVWENQSGMGDDVYFASTAAGRSVFAGGRVLNAAGDHDFVVRAYDAGGDDEDDNDD